MCNLPAVNSFEPPVCRSRELVHPFCHFFRHGDLGLGHARRAVRLEVLKRNFDRFPPLFRRNFQQGLRRPLVRDRLTFFPLLRSGSFLVIASRNMGSVPSQMATTVVRLIGDTDIAQETTAPMAAVSSAPAAAFFRSGVQDPFSDGHIMWSPRGTFCSLQMRSVSLMSAISD